LDIITFYAVIIKGALVVGLSMGAFICFIIGVTILIMPKHEYDEACRKGKLHEAMMRYDKKGRQWTVVLLFFLVPLAVYIVR